MEKNERSALIRLASTMEKGSEERRAILAFAAVPKHVLDFAEVLRKTLASHGLVGANLVKPFNSGNVGIVVDLQEHGKYIFIDQPGVVGLEDHNPGFIAFGEYPQGMRNILVRHRDRNFGDVSLTDSERSKAQRQVLMQIEKILR